MLKEDTSDVGKLEKRNLLSGEFSSTVPPAVTLVAAIQEKMTEQGINATQLAQLIGFSKSKVSEILNRKRPLSKKMAKALYGIGIEADVLFNALIADDC